MQHTTEEILEKKKFSVGGRMDPNVTSSIRKNSERQTG